MNPENAIEVRDVHKYFKVYDDKGKMLRERIIHWNRNKFEKREVLKGISFDVKKGEAIGLIGTNGCGKSTTLKLLTKILRPNSGSIDINGKVYSMIELGAGFHPDMSGRENIYINASIFGVKAKEVDKRIDDIIDFSELEDFIDEPVRTYSSGMYMRLAFAVAINMDADILLVDEILAVGDAAFQAKCFNKLRSLKSKGTTIVIVSHSLSQIEQICDRSIWIHKGVIREEGIPRVVDPHYLEFMSKKVKKEVDTSEQSNKEISSPPKNDMRWGSGEAVMTSVKVYDSDGKNTNTVKCNDSCDIVIEYKAKRRISDAVVGIAIYRDDKTYIYGSNTLIDTAAPVSLEGYGTIKLKIKALPLNEGKYTFDFAFHKPDGFNYDFWREALTIEVENRHQEVGIVSLDHVWSIE